GWREIFSDCYPLAQPDAYASTQSALREFAPDAVYVHKMADLRVLQALVESGLPLVRMVHDHDLYCMRSYKYFPLSRRICTRAAGWRCVVPCGAVLTRNRNGGLPLRWSSYRGKKKNSAST